MVHHRLALNSMSTATWPLQADLELCAELGVARSGIFLGKAEAVGLERAVALVTDAGLEVTEVACQGPTPSEPARWGEERSRLRRALELAVAVGSPVVSVTTGSAGSLEWEAAAAGLGESLAPVVDAAARQGVVVAIEQTLPLRHEVGFVHSCRDSVDLARRFGLGVVLEAHYCFAERGIAETVHQAGDVLAVVQVSDLVPPLHQLLDRAVPGDGVIPLERLIRHILDGGYQGCFELEMLGPRIEAEGYAQACRRGVEALDAILRAAGA